MATHLVDMSNLHWSPVLWRIRGSLWPRTPNSYPPKARQYTFHEPHQTLLTMIKNSNPRSSSQLLDPLYAILVIHRANRLVVLEQLLRARRIVKLEPRFIEAEVFFMAAYVLNLDFVFYGGPVLPRSKSVG
jgi:hypothetical protein